jgi:hypothetical protein
LIVESTSAAELRPESAFGFGWNTAAPTNIPNTNAFIERLLFASDSI